jgi:deoxyhypusine synthase
MKQAPKAVNASPSGGPKDGQRRSRRVLPRRALNDGYSHGLTPVMPLDVRHTRSVSELVAAMGLTSFGARTVGQAAEVLYRMTKDPDCFVVCTVSGAMTVAKMGLVLCEMIERDMVHAIVSTGALITHGLVENTGLTHFQTREDFTDEDYFAAGYNRVYDTLELEANLNETEALVRGVLEKWPPRKPVSSWRLCQAIGRLLNRKPGARGVLRSAYRRKVPIFIPAFTDCELGLDFALFNHARRKEGKPPLYFDPFDDLDEFATLCSREKKLGIFTIGGGVPRNWAQQLGPYLDLLDQRLGIGTGFKPYHYGVRICPDPAHWGHLSGCTYSEGISWGKFVPPRRGGMFAEVLADATIVWPLIVRAVVERIARERRSSLTDSKPAGAAARTARATARRTTRKAPSAR